tara:strand:+ start:8062 stop:8502 length:441 start_codon:yes stop_codon:yes gene_type:complete
MKSTICEFQKVILKEINDHPDGNLSVAEESKDIPFQIKRVYYIYDLRNAIATRGKHAHKNLEQVLFCISGSFKLLLDDGKTKMNIEMDKPNEGIYIGKYIWHTMCQFSKDCIILVLASDYFKESDYIRDYDEFISITKNILDDKTE